MTNKTPTTPQTKDFFQGKSAALDYAAYEIDVLLSTNTEDLRQAVTQLAKDLHEFSRYNARKADSND